MIAGKWPHPHHSLLLGAEMTFEGDAHSSEKQTDNIAMENYGCMETSGFYSA